MYLESEQFKGFGFFSKATARVAYAFPCDSHWQGSPLPNALSENCPFLTTNNKSNFQQPFNQSPIPYLCNMSVIQKPIYLDYHATTPVDPDVLKAMLPYFTTHFGNPASRSHPYGWKASEAVELARNQVAELLSVNQNNIFFTSGSTEGLNMAIKGLSESLRYKGKHIITISTEHHAVLDPLQWLSTKGFEITKLPVDDQGMIDLIN